MNLSLSNIGFLADDTEKVYKLMQQNGYTGLEIAPSILVGAQPYSKINEAKTACQSLESEYGLEISSMQSIWYGCEGNIFVSGDAEKFEEYTKKASEFAGAINCKNLVFGCPKNRNIPQNAKAEDSFSFFESIAKTAIENGTNIALEANPTIYGTNFCNTSKQAFDFAKNVNGLKINYDLGTLLANNESLQILADNLAMVNHIHISEPNLNPIEIDNKERLALHHDLAGLLKAGNYNKYISIEMKGQPLSVVERVLYNVAKVFA